MSGDLPRADDTAPAGTVTERWWQRSAFKATVGTVVGLWLPILGVWIEGAEVSRAALSAATVGSVTSILVGFGVIGSDKPGLRRLP